MMRDPVSAEPFEGSIYKQETSHSTVFICWFFPLFGRDCDQKNQNGSLEDRFDSPTIHAGPIGWIVAAQFLLEHPLNLEASPTHKSFS